jgi:hypothetical protein
MSYTEFEILLIETLKKNGWVDSFVYDRQDTYIKWTDFGKSKFVDFINEIQKIFPNQDKDFENHLKSFCYYHGILRRTDKEQLMQKFSNVVLNEEFILLILSKDKSFKTYLFDTNKSKDLFEILDIAIKEEKEIIAIPTSRLLISNTLKIFPFGSKEYI